MDDTLAKADTEFLWIEAGEARSGLVAEVAPLLPFSKTYSFLVPPTLESTLKPGHRVHVPIGRKGRLVEGFVVALDRRVWDATLRPIASMADSESYLNSELIALGRELSAHYACPLGRTLNALVPRAVRDRAGIKRVRYASLATSVGQAITEVRGSKQRRLLEVLADGEGALAVGVLLKTAEASSASLKSLVDKGLIKTETREETPVMPDESGPVVEPELRLTEGQEEALRVIRRKIEQNRFSVTLLFGVSGSGKTEAYIRALQQVLRLGRQGIMLVPEIALTTQMVHRLTSRFERVAVNHSGLTDRHRSLLFSEIQRGSRDVVIGTRSAVFAPCPNLGLIVVDEEQETSYKNLQAPRFHVRDVAIARAKQLDIPCLLGSATPSLEVWHRSTTHPDYTRVTLSRRVKNLPMPQVLVVDMRDEQAERGFPPVISRAMEHGLSRTLARKEQAIILVNRRGFASRLFCPACRTRVECPNCKVGFVVHIATGQSACHYCHSRIPTPTHCANPSCHAALQRAGIGTQRVEQVLGELFPAATITRADSDTMTHRSKYESLIDEFQQRRIDVIVGTQMIAKGLDFPFVSFVGVINADPTSLTSDFRAQERLFQLVTQVAGRAGRSETPGSVIVQTTFPDISALEFAPKHDYPSFAEGELADRKRFGWPPFSRLARVVVTHRRDDVAAREAEAMAGRFRAVIAEHAFAATECLGPNPCALARLRGVYRHELLVRSATALTLRDVLKTLDMSGATRCRSASSMIDVDPVSLT
ncbi:MAG: primosomal protein N' [Phycisphaerae bacterium]